MATDIRLSTEVGMDTSPLRQSKTVIQNELKAINKSLNAQKKAFRDVGMSVEDLADREEMLGRAMSKQKKIINEKKTALENVQKSIKDVNNLTSKEVKALENAKGALSKAQYEYRGMTNEMKKVNAEQIKLEKSTSELSNEIREIELNTKKQVAALRSQGRAADALKAEHEGLVKSTAKYNQLLDKEKDKLDSLKKNLGENSREVQQQERVVQQLSTKYGGLITQQGKVAESMNKMDNAASDTTTNLEKLRDRLGGTLDKMQDIGQNMSVYVTAPVVAGFGAALKTAADFESQMSRVGAIAGATGKDLSDMSELAKDLGANTSKSASEVAKGMEGLAAMGFSVKDIMGAMPGVISAAESSGADMAQTADVMAAAINGFGLKAADATHVADVLAQTANQSAADITDMQYALKYAGPPAKALGISLEETSAAIGIMTDAGLDGSNAGTALRGSLLGLLSPSEENSKRMKSLGIEIEDSQGNFIGIAELIKQFRKQLSGMSDTQKAATLSTLVGKEAVSGFMTLMEAGPKKIKKMTKGLEESDGASQKAAKSMKDNLKGALEEMGGAFETLGIQIGNDLTPAIRSIANGIQKLVNGFSGLPGWVRKSAIVLGLVAAAAGPLAVTTAILGKAVLSTAESYAKLTGKMTGNTVAMSQNAALQKVAGGTIVKTNAASAKSSSMLVGSIGKATDKMKLFGKGMMTSAGRAGLMRGALTILSNGLKLIGGPIGAIVITAITAIGYAFVKAYKNVKWFRDGINNVWKLMKMLAGAWWDGTKQIVNATLKWKPVRATIDGVKSGIKALGDGWNEFVEIVKKPVNFAIGGIKKGFDAFNGMMKRSNGDIGKFKDEFVKASMSTMNAAKDRVKSAWNASLSNTKSFMTRAGKGMKEGLVKGQEGIKKWATELGPKMSTWLSTTKTSVKSWANSTGSKIGTWFGTSKKSITDWGKKLPGQIKGAFNSATKAVKEWMETQHKKNLEFYLPPLAAALAGIKNFPKKIGEKVDSVKSAISGFFAKAFSKDEKDKKGDPISERLTKPFKDLPKKISSYVESTKKAISSFFSRVGSGITGGGKEGGGISGWWSKIKKWFTDLPGRITSSVNGIKKNISNTITSIFNPSEEDMKKASDKFGKKAKKAITEPMKSPATKKDFSDKLGKTIVDGLSMALAFSAVALLATGREIITRIAKGITGASKGLYTSLRAFFNWVPKKFKSLTGPVATASKAVFSASKKWLGETANSAKSKMGAVYNHVKNNFESARKSATSKAKSLWLSTSKWFGESSKSAKSKFGSVKSHIQTNLRLAAIYGVKKAKELFSGAKSWMEESRKSTKSKMDSVKSLIQTRWRDARKYAVDKAKTMYTGVRDWLENSRKNTGSKTASIKNFIQTRFKDARNSAVNSAKSMYSGVRNWMSNTHKNSSSMANSIKNTVSSKFKAMRDKSVGWVKSIGSYISNAKNGFFKKAKALGNSIANGAISGFNSMIKGINSLSKKIMGKSLIKKTIPTLSTGTMNSNQVKTDSKGRLKKSTKAIVNDIGPGNGTGGYTQELIRKKDGSVYAPKGKNVSVKLKKGDAVINGSTTQSLEKQGAIRFSTGTAKNAANLLFGSGAKPKKKKKNIGDYLSGAWNGTKEAASSTVSSIKTATDSAVKSVMKGIGDVMEYAENPSKLINKVLNGLGVDFSKIPAAMGGVARFSAGKLKSGMVDLVKSWFDSLGGDADGSSFTRFPKTTPYSPNKAVPGYPTAFNNGRHYGIDYGTPSGTPLTAPTSGTVVRQSNVGGGVVARLLSGKIAQYFLHLSKVVKEGRVKKGEKFAITGNSGQWTTGAHLHYQVEKPAASELTNTNTMDPEKFLASGAGGASGGSKAASAWRSEIVSAARKTRTSISSGDIKTIISLIQAESGGNAGIVQHGYVDVNTGGNEARGLLQYVPGTFNAYKMNGYGNIYSGMDQLMAFFNNSNWKGNLYDWSRRYARGSTGWGPTGSRRFAKGTNNAPEGLAMLFEKGGEILNLAGGEQIIPNDVSIAAIKQLMKSNIFAQTQSAVYAGIAKYADELKNQEKKKQKEKVKSEQELALMKQQNDMLMQMVAKMDAVINHLTGIENSTFKSAHEPIPARISRVELESETKNIIAKNDRLKARKSAFKPV